MRAGQPIAFEEEERRGWLELLLNRKKGNGTKKKGFDPVLARAGTVQDLRRAANETKLGRNESVLLEQARRRKWKDDLDTDTLHAKVSNSKKPPAFLREDEGDDQSNSTSCTFSSPALLLIYLFFSQCTSICFSWSTSCS